MLLIGCIVSGSKQHDLPSLHEAFRDDFLLGTATDFQVLTKDPETSELVSRHFNVLTCENSMKSMHIQPEPGRFDFTRADQVMDFAKKNNMLVVGHTLIWHSQLPAFLRGNPERSVVDRFLSEHIETMVSHYKGKVISWDVVNEALNEDGTLRSSIFLSTLGEDYIERAFRLAAKADPEVKLYYNDYNIEQPEKRRGAINLVKNLQAKGVRIDGIGIQGHWSYWDLPIDEIETSIREFAALGLEVAITELDLNVLPRPDRLLGAAVEQNFEAQKQLDPFKNVLPDSVARAQADAYARLFSVLLDHKESISRVTFWGANDRYSWLNNWPVRGRTNHALLFDRDNQPKEAFKRLITLTN